MRNYINKSEIEIGEIFCDKEFLSKKKMEVSIITGINSTLLMILGSEFAKIIENKKEYLSLIKDYPNNQTINEIYKEMKDWQKFKEKSIENVRINKQNKNGVSLNR